MTRNSRGGSRARWVAVTLLLLLVVAVGVGALLLRPGGSQDLTITLPAVDLPAMSMSMPMDAGDEESMADMPRPLVQLAIPVDGWLQGYSVDAVDSEGRQVPHSVIHHVNLIMPGRRELFSPIMLRIGAAGSETEPVELPKLLGFRVHPGDTLLVTAMLHNPTGQAYHGVRIRVHLPYTPAGSLLRPVTIAPFYMDVMPPASFHSYDLPAGRSTHSWEGKPVVSGRILGVGGHMHQYALSLRLEDVTAGRTLWEARPKEDAKGEVLSVPRQLFLTRLGLHVEPDHVYRLTAEYNNPTGKAIPDGAMGALGGIFLPDRSAAWPPADPANPDYRLDQKLTYGGRQGAAQPAASPAGSGAADMAPPSARLPHAH